MCSLLMCNSFRNILSKWISNFILPQLHHLYFLLYELFPTARMSEFFYWLVNLMCFATILLIMKLYVCRVSYSYIIPDLFYYLHSRCLLESLNSWLLPLGYPDFGAVWWFNSLSLSLSFTGAWNQGFWLPIQMHLQMIQKETRPWNSSVTLVNLFP